MIPVVVFAFRRADLLELTLDALRRDAVPEVIAFSDGPRDDEDAAGVAAVRRLLRSVTWCRCQILASPTNLGLGRSVVAGVGETLRTHEAVIVFEDDLVCQPGTYRYLTAALARYADDPRVMSVTGWTHPRITPTGPTSTVRRNAGSGAPGGGPGRG